MVCGFQYTKTNYDAIIESFISKSKCIAYGISGIIESFISKK